MTEADDKSPSDVFGHFAITPLVEPLDGLTQQLSIII